MPDVAELTEDLTERAREAGRRIGSLLKRQYRLRLTNACRVCNNLNLQGHDETFLIGRLDLAYMDIRSAALKGCPHCTLIRTCVEHLTPWVEKQVEQTRTVNFKVMLQYHDDGFLELALGFVKDLKFEIFLAPGKPV